MIGMARSTDSFFIRADLLTENTGFSESRLDLGAYVDALGKSILKIHNVQMHFSSDDNNAVPPAPNGGVNLNPCIAWQLTTQSQLATGLEIVPASNRSVVSTGFYQVGQLGGNGTVSSDIAGVNVQHFTDGYLIGVESLYLGGQQNGLVSDSRVSLVMECTVETLTQSAAMALALSQQ
jgi:hypothetical protein